MPTSRGSNVSAGTFFTLATFALVVAILFVARAVVLPLAMSVLLTALLTPLVRTLERWRIPRIPAVMVLATTLLLFILGLGATIGKQVVELGYELKNYREEIRTKVVVLRDAMGTWDDMRDSMEALDDAADAPKQSAAEPPPSNREVPPSPRESTADQAPNGNRSLESDGAPVDVRVVAQPGSPFTSAREWAATIMEPLGLATMVLVLTIFMLIAQEDLRNRLLVLIGGDRVPGTTQLLEEAWQRVSRYLRMQLLINSIYGVAVFALTFSVGLPNALVFGLQATILRFIPYLGPVLAAGLPLIVTLAVTNGWTTFLVVAACLIVLELIVNNVLEPWLYGASTGVSTVGILISAFFWTWLWGPVGLVLATPLTVCLVVLGRHVPALQFWATLLSDKSPLGPIERLYQRLLARDMFESLDIIEERQQQETASATTTCELVGGALARAAIDHATGEIDDGRLEAFSETFDRVWDEVTHDLELPEPASDSPRALCLPARGVCDPRAARVVAAYLRNEGWNATAETQHLLTHDMAAHACDRHDDVNACVVVAVGVRAIAHARYVCRQLIAQDWKGKVVLLLLGAEPVNADETERLAATGVATTLSELSAKTRIVKEHLRVNRGAEERPPTSEQETQLPATSV